MSAATADGRRPRILISPDLETRATRRGPLLDVVAVDRPYVARILEEGGTPIIAPIGLDDDAVADLIGVADGLLLTGGDFDVDPALFGEAPLPELGTLKPARTALELALLRAAVARGLPVLGVCGGMQLMNVVRGGSLWQDLPSQRPSPVAHSQVQTKDRPGHGVRIMDDTLLRRLCGEEALGVNSTHHQAIKAVGRGLVACAVADDGLVEAIVDPSLPFFLGVQWHPESMFEPAHRAIYRGLIRAAVDGMGDTSRHVR
jgi:putative glutamine amidotransferase